MVEKNARKDSLAKNDVISNDHPNNNSNDI